VVVAGIVMFNIMKLIMEIVPNYPTDSKKYSHECKNIFIFQNFTCSLEKNVHEV
jgi:hypothetical protein